MEKEKQLMAMAVTKALGYTENGGKPNPKKLRAGKSGELKSVFQLTPATWKRYAKEVLGDEKAPLTPDNETYVVSQKVSKWIDEGKNIRQIASIWNAGEGKPNAYKENHRGVNKYGVAYDTPKYAETVVKYASKFIKDPNMAKGISSNIDATGTALTNVPNQNQQLDNEPLANMKKILDQANNQQASSAKTGLLQTLASSQALPKASQ